MTDLDKAKYILQILSTKNHEVEGIQDAFKLTQSYSWLFLLIQKLEEDSKKDKQEK